VDDNTRLFVFTKKEVRSTHEEDGSAFTFHFQDVRPGRLHLLAFCEGDGVVRAGYRAETSRLTGLRREQLRCILLHLLGDMIRDGAREPRSKEVEQ
jgi:hypothetical protein